MKIAIVRKKYSNFGGAERYVASLIEHLVKSGHRVHVFADEWKIDNIQNSRNNITILQIVFHKVPVIRILSFLHVVSFTIFSKRLLKKEVFDVIHSLERTTYQDIYRAGDGCHKEWLRQRTKIDPWYKSILMRLNPLHLILLWIEKQIFKDGKYKMIIANSKRGKNEIIHHYGVPPEKIQVIYNAIDTKRFKLTNPLKSRAEVRKQYGISPQDKILLFVGSDFKRKGLPAVIESLAMLKSDIKLMVIGKDRVGPYRSMVNRLGIREHVYFLGPKEDVERYYFTGDLFIFPTIYDPFSNACLEAMASGMPVITSRVNGASELLETGKNGYIIDNPIDPIEIIKKIQKGLKLSRRSVQEFNSKLLERFSWERHLEQVLDIYESIRKKSRFYA